MESQEKSLMTLLFKEGFPGRIVCMSAFIAFLN